jgi:hypothetical protein
MIAVAVTNLNVEPVLKYVSVDAGTLAATFA